MSGSSALRRIERSPILLRVSIFCLKYPVSEDSYRKKIVGKDSKNHCNKTARNTGKEKLPPNSIKDCSGAGKKLEVLPDMKLPRADECGKKEDPSSKTRLVPTRGMCQLVHDMVNTYGFGRRLVRSTNQTSPVPAHSTPSKGEESTKRPNVVFTNTLLPSEVPEINFGINPSEVYGVGLGGSTPVAFSSKSEVSPSHPVKSKDRKCRLHWTTLQNNQVCVYGKFMTNTA